MKRIIRLAALVLIVAASLTALPVSAQTVQPLWPKSCSDLCAIILCAYPSTCGPFVDSTGTPRCGCHT